MAESEFEFGVTPFYFLRHGETNESRAGILQGQNETELNRDGRRMAEDAAHALSNITLGSIYASPLKRAWRTASVVSVLTGTPLYALSGLMERHWGRFQGRRKELRPPTPNPETVETLEDFKNRVTGAMESISGPSPVLVVAHAGVFRAIADAIGISIEGRVSVTNCEVLKLEPPAASKRKWRISAI